MQGKLSVIEIARYSYCCWFFLLPFQNLNHDDRKKRKRHNHKKDCKQSQICCRRRFNFALCDVRLSLRHLGKIKLVSKNDEVTRTI